MAPTDAHDCASCGQPAQKHCARCTDGVDIDGVPSNPHYCSTACQTAHWPEHKKACTASNHRKQLYNTGEMLQELFYEIKRVCYSIPISRVEEVENMVHIYAGTGKTPILAPFPAELFSNVEAERKGLTNMSCTEACIKMFNTLSAVLGRSYNTIHVRTIITRRKLRVIHLRHNKPSPVSGGHEFFDISLKDGNRFALDLTGAQFGYYRTVTPWDKYLQIFKGPIVVPLRSEPFAAYLTRDTQNIIAMRIKNTEKLQYSVYHTRQLVQHWLTACLNAEMLLFKTNLKSRAERVSLAAAATGPNRKEFIDAVCNGVQNCATWLIKEQGCMKLFARICWIRLAGPTIPFPDSGTQEMANKLRLADELIDGKGTECVDEGYVTHEEYMRQMLLLHGPSVFDLLSRMGGHH